MRWTAFTLLACAACSGGGGVVGGDAGGDAPGDVAQQQKDGEAGSALVAGKTYVVGSQGTTLYYDHQSWTVVATFDSSLGTLADVWSGGGGTAWAVGSGGTIAKWSASSWSNLGVVPDTSDDFTHVYGSGPDDVWAFGGDTPYHWNGVDWTADFTSQSTTATILFAPFGTSTNNWWVVGADWANGEGAIAQFNGAWSGQLTFMIDGSQSILRHVWGSAANDIWAVGDAGAIHHYDGATWTDGRHGWTGPNLVRVWGTSASDVWAAEDGAAKLVHWNGSAWSEVVVPFAAKTFWGSGPTDAWAADARLMHYDGTTWTAVPDVDPLIAGEKIVGGFF